MTRVIRASHRFPTILPRQSRLDRVALWMSRHPRTAIALFAVADVAVIVGAVVAVGRWV